MNPQTLHHPIEYIQQKLLNEECYVYVLIDVNSHQILRGELFNQNDAPIFRSLYHGTLLQELRDQAPYLVQIELNQYSESLAPCATPIKRLKKTIPSEMSLTIITVL